MAVFLYRLGFTGSLFEVYLWFEIGEGTVILLEECKKVHDGFENLEGLKNVIGAVDRTHILMKNTLNKDSEVYFTWKKCYAIHCQGIVNDKGIFTSFDVGWPASVHDAWVFRNFSFYKDYSNLIQRNDYLLDDSAYSIFPFLIPPFKDLNSQKQKDFNRFHSSYRVVVENAFRKLKARFGILRNLDVKTVKMGVLFTSYAIILHNFLEINIDIWEVTFDNNINYENDDISNYTRE